MKSNFFRAALVAVFIFGGATLACAQYIFAPPEAGAPGRYGAEQLEAIMRERGWDIRINSGQNAKLGGDIHTYNVGIIVDKRLSPEAFAVAVLRIPKSKSWILAIRGGDERGAMYGALAVAERIRDLPKVSDSFTAPDVPKLEGKPFVHERSVSVYTMNRAYWESRFYDEKYWTRYFDMLAQDRFNKFLIVFGYENGGFLAPCYPYFFDTPGYPDVHFNGLSPEQQKKNLAAMTRLIELAHARGIQVAVGIWDHIYRGGVQGGGNEWEKEYAGKPVPNTVQGVTTDNLNAYTLASLKQFIETFPGIDEIQFRIHEESGLKREEMDGFWREVFTMTKKVKPQMLFEARAKGTPDSVINTALDMGVNLRVETKFWMEQMGLPFHPTHVNPENQHDRRHGYADLLAYPKRYDIAWRLWNGGTARVLLWADPEYVRRYSQAAALYDDAPVWDVNEPLATKMEAQRPDMAPFDLMPEKYRYYDYEFERYWHFYQVWGRVGYDPASAKDVGDREFARRFGTVAGPRLEAALHRASGVLPMLVASACYPYSAFPTTRGWAERQALGATLEAYAKNTGTDTAQFESFDEAAKRILAGGTTTKRTPDATARWLDETADAVLADVKAAEAGIGEKRGNEFDATVIDLKILAQLARFHARRSMAAVHYNLFKRGLKLPELVAATLTEKEALAAWRELVAVAGDRYNADLAMGARNYNLCGSWRDELVKLEADQTALEAQCCPPEESVLKEKVWQPDTSPLPVVDATRAAGAKPGTPLHVAAHVTAPGGAGKVVLRYRHLTQYEDYLAVEMKPVGAGEKATAGEYAADIPGDFIVPKWDLIYYIEATGANGRGTQWPDLAKEAPYVIVKLER